MTNSSSNASAPSLPAQSPIKKFDIKNEASAHIDTSVWMLRKFMHCTQLALKSRRHISQLLVQLIIENYYMLLTTKLSFCVRVTPWTCSRALPVSFPCISRLQCPFISITYLTTFTFTFTFTLTPPFPPSRAIALLLQDAIHITISSCSSARYDQYHT